MSLAELSLSPLERPTVDLGPTRRVYPRLLRGQGWGGVVVLGG